MTRLLNVENICKSYKNHIVLDNITFEINQGDIIGLIGENGAGKSTLINILAGVIQKDEGRIELLNNISLEECEQYYDNLCTCFDQASFYPYLSGLQNLKMYSSDIEKIEELLMLIGLSKVKNKKVLTYSFGMKQRLNIARAFLMWSRLMIMDEPINGLDPGITIEIKNYIKDKCNRASAVLISSHALKELMYFCNRFIFIHKGKIITDINANENHIEELDAYADLNCNEIVEWIKENKILNLVIPKLNIIYFKRNEDVPSDNYSEIGYDMNILENIYLQMKGQYI